MFTTSDHEPSQKAQTALRSSRYYALRHLDVNESIRGLVISGQVPSYYQKQQAQEIVRLVAGDVVVVNRIEVV